MPATGCRLVVVLVRVGAACLPQWYPACVAFAMKHGRFRQCAPQPQPRPARPVPCTCAYIGGTAPWHGSSASVLYNHPTCLHRGKPVLPMHDVHDQLQELSREDQLSGLGGHPAVGRRNVAAANPTEALFSSTFLPCMTAVPRACLPSGSVCHKPSAARGFHPTMHMWSDLVGHSWHLIGGDCTT